MQSSLQSRKATRTRHHGPARAHRTTPLIVLALAFAAAAPLATQAQPPAERVVAVPQVDWGWEMLELRGLAQQQNRERLTVFHDFGFRDELEASGISFEHRSTADSGKFYQPNHYDHGNGVAVADVDGDELYDIYFVSQLGPNELWRNLGGGRFENITATAGVALANRLSASASFADIDNDGDPDLYVTTVRMGNALFENTGNGQFRDITEAAGLAYSGHSSGATFFDYDGDGLLDLFLSNVGVYTTGQKTQTGYWAGIAPDAQGRDAFSGHLFPERTENSILYRNLGDRRFRDVSSQVGLVDGSWSGDATITDLNGDLRPDLYVLNMQGDDHYYENTPGGFVDRTAEYFPKTPWGSMGVKFFDYDRDGRQDLVITDMHSDMSRKVTPGFEKMKSFMAWSDETLQGGDNNIFGNAFFRNTGSPPLSEISDSIGAENYWPWGVSVADLNADGWEDMIYTSSMNFPYTYGVNSVLLNNRGEGFVDSEFILGIEPRSALTSRPWYDPNRPWLVTKRPWFTVDCAGVDARHPLCQGRAEKLIVLGNVGSRSAVMFDLDQDGDLDVVTNEFHDFPQILVSDLSDKRAVRYLEVRLIGTTSNRDSLGATVTVRAGGASQTRYVDGKSGYLSQSSLPLYFGLGDADRVESVEVTWPSGRSRTVTEGVEINTRLEISEP